MKNICCEKQTINIKLASGLQFVLQNLAPKPGKHVNSGRMWDVPKDHSVFYETKLIFTFAI